MEPPRSATYQKEREISLLRACRAGDAAAWTELVTLNLHRLRKYAENLGCNRDDAEDIAIETLERAWRFRNSLDESRSFLSWLFRIAQNVWKDKRSRTALMTVSLNAPADDTERERIEAVADESANFEGRIQAESFLDCILRGLEERHNELELLAFRRRFLEPVERTYAEIAQELSVVIVTARNYCLRTLKTAECLIAEGKC